MSFKFDLRVNSFQQIISYLPYNFSSELQIKNKKILKSLHNNKSSIEVSLSQIASIQGHKEPIYSLLIISEYILTGSADCSIIVRKRIGVNKQDKQDKQIIHTFNDHKGTVYCMLKLDEFDEANKNIFASGSGDETIKIFDLKQKKCINTLKGHNDFIIKIFNIKNMENSLHNSSNSSDSNKSLILSSSADKTLKLWSIQGEMLKNYNYGEEIFSIAHLNLSNSSSKNLSNNLFAIGDHEYKINIFDLDKNKSLIQLEEHDLWVNNIIFDEYIMGYPALFSGGADNKIIIWNLNTFLKESILEGHDEPVYGLLCLKFKGLKLLISGSEDGVINVWNLEISSCIYSYENNEEVVLSIMVNQKYTPYNNEKTDIKELDNDFNKEIGKEICGETYTNVYIEEELELIFGTGNKDLLVLNMI